MSLATLYSRAQAGVQAPLVTIEVHLANGLPTLNIVGLPELAVKESKDRVRAAILNSKFEFPTRRITINLAPADLPKEGGRFDLAIALGILAASGQLPKQALDNYEVIGELALSGELRPIRGTLPVALATKQSGRGLILPLNCASEAALVSNLAIHPAQHLLEVSDGLIKNQLPNYAGPIETAATEFTTDMCEVCGQSKAKRALEVAAAGEHSLLMIGPPGTGKSMLASRLPGILPSMSEQEALESAIIQSISSGEFNTQQWRKRPFRTPHHTASGVALVGGGSNPRPGEISLAHNGVMFLDELPEFDRKVLEVLREPLESGRITISRAARQVDFPASFQLIAAMNPCPCGYLGENGKRSCRCTSEQVFRYRNRISGPLMDRIDMHIEVPRVPIQQLNVADQDAAERSRSVRLRVEACRQKQLQRCGIPNGKLQGKQIGHTCVIDGKSQQLLDRATQKLDLSARSYHRILKLSRTIADLAGAETIEPHHLGEAIGYRSLDRNT